MFEEAGVEAAFKSGISYLLESLENGPLCVDNGWYVGDKDGAFVCG